MTNSQISQAIVTIAEATVVASCFPSVRIEASSTSEWTYDITAVDPDYNRSGVALEHLVVEVKNVVDELQSRYGEHAERLGDLVLNIRINEKPTGK